MRHSKRFEKQTVGHALRVGAVAAALLLGTSLHAQVYVADSPSAAELVASAEDRLGKQEPAEAARLLQRVLDDQRPRLLETHAGRYAEAHQVAARLLLSDQQLLRTYRQMHGPTADRQLERAGNDVDRLTRLRQRYPATEAAMQAGFREAGLALASGQPEGAVVALRSLRDHPDLPNHRARYEQLLASAALLLDNQPAFEQHLQALQQAGAPDAVAFLERLKQSLRLPAVHQVFSPLDTLPEANLPDKLEEPLWSYDIRGAETYLVEAYQADSNRLEALGEDGRFLNTLFTVSGGVVYLNDGLVVAALDSSSGMKLWERTLQDVESSFQPFGRPYSQWLPYGVDLNGIAVGSDRIAAISGFSAMVTIYGNQRGEGESKLHVLNAKTGETHWVALPTQLDDQLDDAFWYGRPLIHQGRVYATLRRRQRTQFQDAYVVCMDLYNGEVIWRRHIASTALTDRQAVPAMSHMLLSEGHLYVDSRLGTIAKLAAADGSVAWLSLLPIDEEERAQVVQKPWHAPSPVLVEAGLIVLDDWGRTIYAINPATGERLATIGSRDWDTPLYFATVGGDLLSVGGSVIRFDGETLSRIWRHRVRGDHRGRAAVAENRLLLPAAQGVLVLDLENGEPLKQLDIPLPATLVTLHGQVLAAGRDKLRSYSSWDLASEQMERRIAESAGDPRPLMAMAWLAFNTDRPDELLDALDQALELRDNFTGDTDSTMFEQVLTMTRSERGSQSLRRALFDRVAVLADTIEQEVAYRLALGEFHENAEQYEQAMEQYQTLMAEGAYRQQLHQHDGGARQAGLETQRRMQALIAEHGRALYQPYENFAARRLEELVGQADPAPLVALAEAYPMADVTPEVLRQAARREAEQDRLREAQTLLRQASELTENPDHIAKIYGLQAELFEDAQQPHRARAVLRTLSAIYPDVAPIRQGEEVNVDVWLATLAEQPQLRGVAKLNMPLSGEPRSISGRIAQAEAQDAHATPSPHWLFRDRGRFEFRNSEDFELIWSAPLDADDTDLISMDRDRIWLWMPNTGTIRSIDAEDGSIAWQSETPQELSEVEPRPAEPEADDEQQVAVAGGFGAARVAQLQRQRAVPAQVRQAVEAQQRVDRQREAQRRMVAVSDAGVAVVDGGGRIVVFSHERGSVQWRKAGPLHAADRTVIDGRYLVIAGTTADERHAITVYDVTNGELLHTLDSGSRSSLPIRWMDVTEDGLLVAMRSNEVEAFDLVRGQSRWVARPGEDLVGEGGAWLGLDRLVARTSQGDLLWIDLADGQIAGKLPVRGQLQGQITATNDADRWFIISSNRILATDNDGERLWRDAVADVVRHLDYTLTDQHLITLGTMVNEQPDAEGHSRRLYMLDRASGMITHEQDVKASQMLINVMATDGKLLLTGPGTTAVLNGSP